MTVEELIAELQECDPKMLVVMARNATATSGDGFVWCAGADGDNQVFKSEGSRRIHHGTIGLGKLTPELEGLGYTEEDVLEGGTPCVVLWPV